MLTSLQTHFEEQKRVNDSTQRTLQDIARQLAVISSKLGLASTVTIAYDGMNAVGVKQNEPGTKVYQVFDKLSTPIDTENVQQPIQSNGSLDFQHDDGVMLDCSKEMTPFSVITQKLLFHYKIFGVQSVTNQLPSQHLLVVETQNDEATRQTQLQERSPFLVTVHEPIIELQKQR
ncbi:hypothetical protein GQ457_08G026480 [Hibiscus cannabinus]